MKDRRIPRSTLLRFATWISLIVLAFVLVKTTRLGELFTEETVRAFLSDLRGSAWAPLVLIFLFAVLSPCGLPMSPLVFGGAAFGAFHGTIYNTVGLFLGAATSFAVARYMGREVIVRLAGPRLRRVERYLDRQGFWPLVQTRFLPLPFAAVNFASALAGVKLRLFLSSSLAGIFPSTLLHTFFMSKLIESEGGERWWIGALYLLSFVLFNAILSVPSIREGARRRRRYRERLAERRARRPGP